MDVDIVRIGPADAHLLERVAEDVFDEVIDPERLAAYLAEPGHLMVLAIHEGEVVGQARGMVHRHPDQPTELYIDNLGTTPARRREGLATRMLDDLVAWARSLGCEAAWVGTEVDNAPARTLYERRGSEAETFVMYFYEW
ncbi:GNAT family N-acetyltransferase [Phenylobacterium sp.]|uniref:GNAT family N-acetyltransferase n=1 Tax=Phenylobacterium sp. TaxID=1871053 RepID=UPI0025D9E062|nr:GNAT family N-acetyltransferase [Phenylobacterium sp.]